MSHKEQLERRIAHLIFQIKGTPESERDKSQQQLNAYAREYKLKYGVYYKHIEK